MKPLLAAAGIVFGAFGIGSALSDRNSSRQNPVLTALEPIAADLAAIKGQVAGLDVRVTRLETESA